ncbi:MAG: ferritin-like domain-containing protein [Actinomycetota bacterium]|nr:ferritin-like domain-containing protein [Actinomycetota bacterium]
MQFLTRSAALAGASATLAAFGPATQRAAAAGGNIDLEVARFALLVERLEADYYLRAVKEVPFRTGAAKEVAVEFADSETQHVDALEQLVRQLNGRAGRAPRFDFGPALSNEQGFLELAMAFEDTGVSAYNGAGPLLRNDEVLALAGQIVQVEARHAAKVRRVNGVTVAPNSFDPPLTMDEVMVKVKPYIKRR